MERIQVKTVVCAAAIALMILVAAAPAAMSQDRPPMGPPRPPAPAVSVTGAGTVSARPDVAEVATGVITQAPTAGKALAQNSAVMEKVLKAVSALGIADKDVQTSSINVVPQRRQGKQESYPPDITGYEVSNQLRVKVRDLAMLGRLLDELVTQGANNLGGIHFSVAEPAPLLDQARAKAVADARRKAEVYATTAGVKLGRVLSIREATAVVPRPEAFQMRAMAASAVPVAPGEQEFQASVDITYAIE
jgi:uncharacterized protein YggE